MPADVRQAMIDMLQVGPLTDEDLFDGVVAALTAPDSGETRESDEDVRDAIEDEVEFILANDLTFAEVTSGMIYLPAMLEGTTWTTVIDPDDATDGFVRTSPDLDALTWWLVSDGVEVADADGAVLGIMRTDGVMLDGRDTDIVFGPDGWLDDLLHAGNATRTETGGPLVSVAVIDGRVVWTPLEHEPQPTTRQIAAVQAAFERAAAQDTSLAAIDLVPSGLTFSSREATIVEALAHDREAFVDDPVPRSDDLFAATGLETRGRDVAQSGFDWSALDAWRTANRMTGLYGLDPDEAAAFPTLWDASRAVIAADPDALGEPDEHQQAAQRMASLLDRPKMAEALWERHLDEAGTAQELLRFVDEMWPYPTTDSAPDGVDWLRARCLDHTGDTDGAVAVLDEAVARGTTHPLVLLDAAGHASDRGDAVGALRLVRAAGVTGEPDDGDSDPLGLRPSSSEPDTGTLLFHEVVGYATHRPRPTARRNDPCPCGSGKKYKVCHLGKETIPLEDRAPWLMQKAERFARARAGDATSDIAGAIVDVSTDYSTHMTLRDAPFVTDLLLHELGLFDAFLAARSHVLPDDEALAAAQWNLVDRAVFEVTDFGDDWLEILDIGTGDRIRVDNVYSSEHTAVGTVLVGRPVPVGDSYRSFSGFLTLPRKDVADMLDAIGSGDPFTIARVLGRQFQAPGLRNTDGEHLLFHTLRWALPAATGVADLTQAFERIGLDFSDDPPSWRHVADTESMPNATVLTFTLDGDDLIAEANSAERAELAESLVDEAVPAAELVNIEHRTPDELAADGGPGGGDGFLTPQELTPELREALEQHIRQMEDHWIDESIPALDGRTPRDAVEDPIGREMVVQLLATFPPVTDDMPGMDPDRLRHLLGL